VRSDVGSSKMLTGMKDTHRRFYLDAAIEPMCVLFAGCSFQLPTVPDTCEAPTGASFTVMQQLSLLAAGEGLPTMPNTSGRLR
jgi:hypothetical protein